MTNEHKELLRKAMDQRYDMAKEIWLTMKAIDYQTLAICAAAIRSMSNAPSTDQDEKDAEACAASDWAVRVWFDALTLSLFLQGKIKVSGSDINSIVCHIDKHRLPADSPPAFVELLTYVSEE
jgi:hypothetical protein